MTLNKTAIEWCDFTWNPVTGCLKGCPYCYVKPLSQRFPKAFPNGTKPTFHHERLKDPYKAKNSSSIFVVSAGDLFGDWVPDAWINDVLTIATAVDRHQFIFLTKNPRRMLQKIRDGFYKFGEKFFPSKVPSNLWFGTTVTCEEDIERIDYVRALPTENRFVSFEPLLGNPGSMLDLRGIKQVIIGAQTNPTVMPPDGAINRVVSCAMWYENKDTKIFFKDSLYDDCHHVMRELHWLVHK